MNISGKIQSAIAIFCVFLSISAGCITQHESLAQPTTISPAQTPVQITSTTIQPTDNTDQSKCPPRQNETLWIHINPIGTQYDGENFTISGTTNIEAGKEVIVDAVPDPSVVWSGNDAAASTGYYYIPPSTPVIFGSCGSNVWSMDINTASYSHKYGKKTATVYAGDNLSVSGSASFAFEAGPRQ